MISRPYVDEQDMIRLVINNSVYERNELCLTLLAETTLEYGVLNPLSVPIHHFERATPAPRIADIVSDDINVLVFHLSARRKIRVLSKLPKQVAGKQSSLKLE